VIIWAGCHSKRKGDVNSKDGEEGVNDLLVVRDRQT
jgi:hypothetical protein